MKKIRILLADDHIVLRQGLAKVLEDNADIEVLAQASDGVEALALAKKHKPDVALIDINMPKLDGVKVTREINSALPDTGIIILTMYKRDDYVFDAIKAGANGYLLKEVELEELLSAIRKVAKGEAVIDPAIAEKILTEFRPQKAKEEGDDQSLSDKDREILGLLAKGLSNIEIGEAMNMAEKTVRNRLSGIFKQLHIRNRTEAALFALRKGFTDEE